MSFLRAILFWLREQPDPDPSRMSYPEWLGFVNSIAGVLVIAALAAIAIAVAAYAWQARRLRITEPGQYFAPYRPLRWLWIMALVPAAIVMWWYTAEYKRLFPNTLYSPVGQALLVSIWAWVLTYAVARTLVMLPGVTPRKYRYRPLGRLVPSAHIKTTGETGDR